MFVFAFTITVCPQVSLFSPWSTLRRPAENRGKLRCFLIRPRPQGGELMGRGCRGVGSRSTLWGSADLIRVLQRKHRGSRSGGRPDVASGTSVCVCVCVFTILVGENSFAVPTSLKATQNVVLVTVRLCLGSGIHL